MLSIRELTDLLALNELLLRDALSMGRIEDILRLKFHRSIVQDTLLDALSLELLHAG